MDDWRYNPYHGKKQRDFLVKLEIDFLGDMGCGGGGDMGGDGQQQQQQEQGQGVGGSSSGGKDHQGVLGHRILPMKKKSYGKNEDEM